MSPRHPRHDAVTWLIAIVGALCIVLLATILWVRFGPQPACSPAITDVQLPTPSGGAE